MRDYQPSLDNDGVAWCAETCQQFDGKRCQLIGFRPHGICEPWARDMAAIVSALPKTADGEPVFRGKEVFSLGSTGEIWPWRVRNKGNETHLISTIDGEKNSEYTDHLYSTREAAEKSRGQK
jgi:hypothetical protein